MRGRHKPPNCVDETIITDHINSFNPQISHYRREHAPRRRYLPPEVTIKSMFADFLLKHPGFCSYDKYRKVVQKLNISFCKLGEEECEFCLINASHKCQSTDATVNNNLNEISCRECQLIREHKSSVDTVRKLYTKDKERPWSSDYSFRSVDLQKVLMMPRLPGVKTAVFTRRLVVFHETFVPLKSLDNSVSVLWHEAISGRNAEDIASTFICAMKQEPDVSHFILWMDNCSAQNKNWVVFTAMCAFVNTELGPQSVTFKYLITGHTFMSADAFHAKVEKEIRAKKNLFDFDDLKEAVSNANKTAKVMSLEAADFQMWKSGAYRTRQQDSPLLSSLHQVRFIKGSRSMYYKLDPCGNELECNFLTKKFKLTQPVSKSVSRGIPGVKKTDIVTKLCPLMPEQKQQFWRDLTVCDVPDLIDSDDRLTVDENN